MEYKRAAGGDGGGGVYVDAVAAPPRAREGVEKESLTSLITGRREWQGEGEKERERKQRI